MNSPLKIGFLTFGLGIASIAIFSSCRKNGGGTDSASPIIPVGVSAGALAIKSASLTSFGTHVLQKASLLSTTAPNISQGEYFGMGINYGETVVEGMKIRLVGISIGSGVMGQQGAKSLTLFNWENSPKELQIAGGFNERITDSTNVSISAETYTFTSLIAERNFDIKAYAYLDHDGDGTIDTTIYTTASAVKSVSRVVSAEELNSSSALAYDYYHYDFIGNGPANDTQPYQFWGNVLAKPISVCETPQTPALTASASATTGSLADECVEVSSLNIDILIDTSRIVKVWDGRFGDANIPVPGEPFPNNPHPTNGATYGFKEGEPAFGLLYVPAFGFVSADTAGVGSVASETYMLSQYPVTSPNFKAAETYRFTVVFDEKGAPFTGQSQANSPGLPLFVGGAARLFEASTTSAGTFQFYTGGDEIDPDTNVFDGGLDYHLEKTKAAHRFEGFKSIATIGDSLELKQYDEKRCDSRKREKLTHDQMNNPLSCAPGDQVCEADPLGPYQSYNHCVTFRKTIDTNYASDFAIDAAGKTYRKVYLTRVK